MMRSLWIDGDVIISDQVITFIDLAGHEKYLKTTVFGMTGHAPDFSMLMVLVIIAMKKVSG